QWEPPRQPPLSATTCHRSGGAALRSHSTQNRRHAVMSGTTLDDYTDRYAQRIQGMTPSEIRALFAGTSRPAIVSLSRGAPYVAALPLDAVGEMFARLGSEFGTTTLQYGIGQGDLTLREQICEVMSLSGIDVGCGASPEDV